MSELTVDSEFRGLIPPLSEEERAGLERSILAEGVRDPIVVWGDTIVDGHNRHEIATGSNKDGVVLSFATVSREFAGRAEAMVYIIENQLSRRNLDTTTRIELGQRFEPLEREAAKERQGQRNDLQMGAGNLPQNFGEGGGEHTGETDERVAKKIGVSRETYRKGKHILRFGDRRIRDELKEQDFSLDNAYHLVRVGEKFPDAYAALWELDGDEARMRYSTPQLKHLLKMPDDETALDLVELVESGNAKSFVDAHEIRRRERKEAERQRKREEHRAALRDAPEHKRRYEVVYADPPWRYDHSETTAREVENQYPTMTLDELKALEVPADEDSVLFMWATSPKLVEALEVMDAWGFSYRTCMVWVKDRIGMGYYARQRHEILLIGKRGEPPVPEPSDRPDSVVEAPRGKHSEKPVEFHEAIERMYPERVKVELFARAAREGWDAWGNQSLEEAS